MSGVLWTAGILVYLGVGVGLARLRAWQVMRHLYVRSDLQAEMLCWMFLWPGILPCYLLAIAIRWALFPWRLR